MLLVLSLVAVLAVAAYLVRLSVVLLEDRPTSVPRSHPDQVDPASRPFAHL